MSIDPLRNDPYTGFRYTVEIESVASGSFSTVEISEATGIDVAVETEEYAEGGVNHSTHLLPTRVKHSNLVLKRGLTLSTELWEWIQSTVETLEVGQLDRKNVRIILLNSLGVEVRGWEVKRAFPVKWTGPGFTAEGNEIAIETLEIAHEGISSKGWTG